MILIITITNQFIKLQLMIDRSKHIHNPDNLNISKQLGAYRQNAKASLPQVVARCHESRTKLTGAVVSSPNT